MSLLFTDHAVEDMRKLGLGEHDLTSLLAAVERAAINPAAMQASGDVVRVPRNRGEKVFIVRGGNMRVVLAIDPDHPEQVSVASVYQVQHDNAIQAHAVVSDVPPA